MTKIAIITDTDASLPSAIARKHGIDLVPISVQFGEESYLTGVDLDDLDLFKLIDARKTLPTTAAPSPDAFYKAYQRAFDAGSEEVICICVSSKISATYQAALTARELLPEKTIRVVDAMNLSMAQGFMVLAAAEAAEAGMGSEEIERIIADLQGRVHVFGVLPTLKYLAMGGRMSKLSAGVADTLDIKPILTSRGGKLDLLEKVRTMNKAEARLVELVGACTADREVEKLAFVHVNNLSGAQSLYKKVKAELGIEAEPIWAEFTPGLSVHAGAGMIGIAFVTK